MILIYTIVRLYLTDSKSRRMKGLYTQLCARGRVAATPDIERDAERQVYTRKIPPKGFLISLFRLGASRITPTSKIQRDQSSPSFKLTLLWCRIFNILKV